MCLNEISCYSAREKMCPANLSHDGNGTQHQLVQVAIHHEVSEMGQRVIETSPDLLPDLIRNLQQAALLLQTLVHQFVHLRPRTGTNINSNGSDNCEQHREARTHQYRRYNQLIMHTCNSGTIKSILGRLQDA